ncbi:hypothetical protein B0H21DRAFT_157574 [Amylocystis lapponica]|nr:hypothetical protein B0H21DRAFT_157574 [Amylocystis lapponica]
MKIPFQQSSFSLDTSAVAGFFGGDETAAAMSTLHIYQGRRYLGFYNSPGSYKVAKRLVQLANSKFWDGTLPGISTDPATFSGLSDKAGPKYIAAKSGTALARTGHCGYLFTKECEEREPEPLDGRETRRIAVTIADLHHAPNPHITPTLVSPHAALLASIPIGTSIGTSVACAVVGDWYCCSMILLGTIAGGLSCLALGSGKLTFTHPKPAPGAPVGDGWLRGDEEIIVLKGAEAAVTTVTRGSFALRFSSSAAYRGIQLSAALLLVQFLAQLVLVPQGTLFGQIMFVTSLAVAWAYNASVSSLDKEKIQRDILCKEVLRGPSISKFSLGTWTTAVVFVLLVARPDDVEKKLKKFIPNDTRVWRIWKETVIARMKGDKALRFDESDFAKGDLEDGEQMLLKNLYGDAQAAYGGYQRYLATREFHGSPSRVSQDDKEIHTSTPSLLYTDSKREV